MTGNGAALGCLNSPGHLTKVPCLFRLPTLAQVLCFRVSRGRILGRIPDKSINSFPPYYSQSPLQLCLRFPFLQTHAMQPLTVSVKKKVGKPDRKPYPLPYGLRNPYRNLKSENSQKYAQKLYVHEFGFWNVETSQLLCMPPSVDP